MIQNIGTFKEPEYEVSCDNCGDTGDETFDTFDEALEYKQGELKSLGWCSHKKNGAWEDACPDCNPYKNQSAGNRKPIKRSVK